MPQDTRTIERAKLVATKALNASIQGQIDQFIGIRRVCEITGFSRSSILRKEQAGEIPAPVIQDGNVKRYSLVEIQAWQERKKQERAARQAVQQVAA